MVVVVEGGRGVPETMVEGALLKTVTCSMILCSKSLISRHASSVVNLEFIILIQREYYSYSENIILIQR